ncbi:MAG: FHA domain-containing protein [Gammaproteobacteria bacterium]
MYPILRWKEKQKKELSIDIENRVFIGRSCIGMPENQSIIIDEPAISRDHAMVTFKDNQLTIKDTSRNGTRLNGARISPGVDLKLVDGDLIEIGDYCFYVDFEPERVAEQARTDITDTQTVSLNEYVTHLVADVRGFSTLTQKSESSNVFNVMSDIYDLLSEIVHANSGTVKDYAGDCVFAYWEHGQKKKQGQAALACIAAVQQLRALENVLGSSVNATDPGTSIKLGWGIATGKVTMSHYGLRQDNVAVVGDATNLAFRLSAKANNTLTAPIVICEETAKLVRPELSVEVIGEVETKGRSGKEKVYKITDK